MIDFQSGGVFARLGPSDPGPIAAELAPILVNAEAVHLSFKGMRDSVVFTKNASSRSTFKALPARSATTPRFPTARSRPGDVASR
jgi:hypothetical protein